MTEPGSLTPGRVPARVAYGLLAIRLALALVFCVFGLEKITAPHRWFAFLPAAMDAGLGPLDPAALLRILGAVELIAATTLASAALFRLGCLLGLTVLGGATLSVGSIDHAIRDLGLLVTLAGLTISGPGPFVVRWPRSSPTVARSTPSLKSWVRVSLLGSVALLVVSLAGVVDGVLAIRVDGLDEDRESRSSRSRIFRPVPNAPPLDSRRVALGKRLFHDTRLSRDHSLSCASCHRMEHGGAQATRVFTGVDGQSGSLNTPTVLNASLNPMLTWNGRATSLEEQANDPITNPAEMGATWPAVVAALRADPDYPAHFAAVYEDGITRDNILNAIATFERTLVTPGAPFDRFLAGEDDALSAMQKRGFELFQSVGCASCHQGVNLGGNMIQRMGIMADYFEARGDVTVADYGRYNVTKRESDRYRFRVPSLRNVADTSPYLHDGTATTLETVIQVMAEYQAGAALSSEEVAAIAAFLRSLSAPIPDGAAR